MSARRYQFGVLGLWVVLSLVGASRAGAQCAAPACAGPADCSVDDALGNDVPGCCATACKTIQFAIGEASVGNVIKVAAGIYPENPGASLNVNKMVTLCGAQAGVDARTRVAAESRITNPRGTIVSASNVILDGFTFESVTNSIFPYGVDMAQGTEGTQVYNDIFQNNIAGIGLANTGPSQVLICQNLFQNNNQPGSATGSGIYTDQFVCGSAGGLRPCTNFLITENAFKGNDNAGVDLSNTDTTAITNVDIGNNTFDMNGRAVLLFNVDQSTIHNNRMTNSTLAGSGDIRIFGPVDDLSVTSNDMSGGAGWAIRIANPESGGPSSGIAIHLNNIANYAGDGPVLSPFGGGLFVGAGAYPGVLDAGCNWWDDPCGPFNVTNNPLGIGEEVKEDTPSNVDFSPWLIAAGPAPVSGGGTCTGIMCQALPPDHFQCYEVKPSIFSTAPVTVQDQFGTLTGTLRFPHRLCNPTNKNSEGIIDQTDHLVGYSTIQSGFTRRTHQMLVDQFGTLFLDVTRPDLLLVPSSKDGVPQEPPLDHFQCYKVKRSPGTPKFVKRTVTITNQFETQTTTLLVTKPFRLCAPANKNNEDPSAPSHPDHLTCYKTKGPRFTGSTHTITNQFEPNDVLEVIHRRELCVPSLKNPVPTTTTTTTTIATSTTTTTSSSSTTTSTTVVGSPNPAFVNATLD